MAVHAPTKPPQRDAGGPPKRLFNVDEYYRMAELGILPAEGRLELIEGVIYEGGGMKRRFTVDDYHQMAEAGILTEDERVELIEGEIVQMMTIGNRHAACVKRVNRWFVLGLRERAIVGVQDPIRLGEVNEPQPDLSIVRPRADFYASGHPSPADVLLLIEVADSSAPLDRAVKVPLYARHGIRELWLVDLEADIVEVDAAVDLAVGGLPLPTGDVRLTHYRIDEGHSNAYALWKRMGSPIAPNAEQYAQLVAAGQLARMEAPATLHVEKGQAALRFALPRQAVSLVVLDW